MSKHIVRLQGSIMVNIWRDVEVELDDNEDDPIDAANNGEIPTDGWSCNLTNQKVGIDDITAVEWQESKVIS